MKIKVKDLSNENIIHINKNGIQYLQFRKLLEYKDILSHAYGCGNDVNYRTVSHTRELSEEEKRQAIQNYENLCNQIGADSKKMIRSKQRHTDRILLVDNLNEASNENEPFDGSITNKSEIVLGTTNADCILMILFDPVKKVLANVHSGWRGTLQRISVKAINKMKEEFKSNPQDIICCMAPSIRKCHFEVEKDVEKLFKKEFQELPYDEFIKKQEDREKWNIDTIFINRRILLNQGLKLENIIDSGICSCCNCDSLHSYRVEREKYGLNTLVAMLN